MVYSFDEVTGALQFSHKIELQNNHMLSILFELNVKYNLTWLLKGKS